MIRPQIVLAIATTAAIFTAVPAMAQGSVKSKTVTLPASALPNADSRICMPRSTSPVVAKDKTLPATLCQTRDAWAAHGVTIVTR